MANTDKYFQQGHLTCPDCGQQNVWRRRTSFGTWQGSVDKWREYFCRTIDCNWQSQTAPQP